MRICPFASIKRLRSGNSAPTASDTALKQRTGISRIAARRATMAASMSTSTAPIAVHRRFFSAASATRGVVTRRKFGCLPQIGTVRPSGHRSPQREYNSPGEYLRIKSSCPADRENHVQRAVRSCGSVSPSHRIGTHSSADGDPGIVLIRDAPPLDPFTFVGSRRQSLTRGFSSPGNAAMIAILMAWARIHAR